jgi:hypothetical protein
VSQPNSTGEILKSMTSFLDSVMSGLPFNLSLFINFAEDRHYLSMVDMKTLNKYKSVLACLMSYIIVCSL